MFTGYPTIVFPLQRGCFACSAGPPKDHHEVKEYLSQVTERKDLAVQKFIRLAPRLALELSYI